MLCTICGKVVVCVHEVVLVVVLGEPMWYDVYFNVCIALCVMAFKTRYTQEAQMA